MFQQPKRISNNNFASSLPFCIFSSLSLSALFAAFDFYRALDASANRFSMEAY